MKRSYLQTLSQVALGLLAIAALLIAVPAFGGGTDKVTLCHISTDYPYAQTITVGAPAVAAHLANHGDYLGQCATIEVKKVTDPTSDPGKFNLKINGVKVATDVGNGGTSYPRAVVPGSTTNYASEADGTGTTLDDYNSHFVCKKGAATVASGTGTATPDTLTAVAGKNIVCTFTNQRKANVELRKVTVPADGSLWSFEISNAGIGSNKTYELYNDQATPFTSGAINVDPTNVEMDEWAGTGADIADYSTSVACTDNGAPMTLANTGTYYTPTRFYTWFPVEDGHSYVCTFTNTAKATVQVKKDTEPSTDGSKWNFIVTNGNDATYKTYTDEAVPFNTGALEILGAANIEIDEWAGTGTNIDNYAASVVCTDDGTPMTLTAPSPTYYAVDGQTRFYAYFPVQAGHAYVCTFTNTHVPYAGEVVLSGPNQRLGFTGMAAPSAGSYVYVNVDAVVDYTGTPSCVDADPGAPTTLRFAYQIPPGEGGLTGLWLVWKVTGGPAPTAGFSVAIDGTDAATKCGNTGFVPASSFTVVSSTLNF